MKQVTILGSTGSIGTQAIAVCKKTGYRPLALTAHSSAQTIIEQAGELLPRYVVLTEQDAFAQVRAALANTPVEVLFGIEGLCKVASLPEADIVLNALSGMVGLRPTLAALEAGKTVALANKETLVAGGALINKALQAHGGKLIPVDSEHTAIFQCIQGEAHNKLKKIFLTASGGPFFGRSREELQTVTLADALQHPKWNMGRKITVDSATLMNKGLEFIECIWNFGVTPEQIEVVVHPEALIHSAVEFEDNSVIAQLSDPDMQLAIQYALTYPDRCESNVRPFSFVKAGKMTFFAPDLEAFPCLALAIRAISEGGTLPCILNGANEVAVAAFLEGRIGFCEIADLVAAALEAADPVQDYTLEDVLAADGWARDFAERYITERL